MMSILDHVAQERQRISFAPTTVRQLFVLRLAQKLGEPAAVAHYAQLAGCHSDETLLLAYRQMLNHGHPPRDLARNFHVKLAEIREQDRNGRGDDEQGDKLLAVKVERRSVAVAVFVGTTVDFHDLRRLSQYPDKAQASAVSFLTWVIENLGITSAALERMTNGNEIRRAVLNRLVLDTLRANTIPVWEVDKPELLEAYGYPPLRSRVQLRQGANAILWSMFTSEKPNDQEMDAAAVGLHVQIERLFYKP